MVTHDWRSFLPYTTQRRLRVDVWQLGLAYKILQIAILTIVAVDLFETHGWAHQEVPAGRINAYGEATDPFKAMLNPATPPVYCNSPEHDYVFSDNYKYSQPVCRDMDVEEVVTKSIGAVTFTTSIIESIELAWECDDASNTDNTDAQYKVTRCGYMGASVDTDGKQCKCKGTETYYVKGVEKMGLAFEHGYSTTHKAGSLDGSSAVGENGLDTTIGSGVTTGGERILLPLEDLIALNYQGVSLDSINKDVSADQRGGDQEAHFRATGMKLTVDIEYSNLFKSGRAGLQNSDVDATIKVSAAGGWAGPGPQIFYSQAPTVNSQGSRTYEKMVRYRQGVEVVFRPSGIVYAFNYQHFINVFLGAYLFLAVAVFIMDFIAFNVLPNGVSKVLYAKRAERVSKVHSFAQLGLRAAVAVKDFRALDVDNQGYVEVKDLVSVFGTIPSVSKDEAMMMAQTIMRAANVDTALGNRLTFNEFMSLFDGTTALDFDQFVKLVHTTGKAEHLGDEARNAASQAYDDVAAGVDLAARRSSGNEAVAPPTQLNCFLCKTRFGVSPGAKLTKCPHCLTINPTDARPPPQQAGLLGGFGMRNFGGHLGGLFQQAPAPAPAQAAVAPVSSHNPPTQAKPSGMQDV